MESSNDVLHAKMLAIIVAEQQSYYEFSKTEAPYNYYGDRGVVDFLTFDPKHMWLTLWEVKTNLQNIGEAIRQLNKAEKYFLQDTQNNNELKRCHYRFWDARKWQPIEQIEIGPNGERTTHTITSNGKVHIQKRLVFLDSENNWKLYSSSLPLLHNANIFVDVIRENQRFWTGKLK